jgi:uroporphyrinogen decarboxylase
MMRQAGRYPGPGGEARLEVAAATGVDALSLDWRCDLAAAHARVGDRVRLLGNLDPTVLLSDPATIERSTAAMLAAVPAGRGHLANLGHGILKETPPEQAVAFVRAVQAFPAATAS